MLKPFMEHLPASLTTSLLFGISLLKSVIENAYFIILNPTLLLILLKSVSETPNSNLAWGHTRRHQSLAVTPPKPGGAPFLRRLVGALQPLARSAGSHTR